MDKLKLCLVAVVVLTQMASVAGAGRVYTDDNVAQFHCTPRSPEQPPDYYKLTTGGVKVLFPLTHIFCGEISQGYRRTRATGFHSTAAHQSEGHKKSAMRVGGEPTWAKIYHSSKKRYIQVTGKTFFCSSLTVRGLSMCISMWAAECYNNNINYSGNCMHLTGIRNLANGIQVFFTKSGGPGQVTLTLKTAYPPAYPKKSCITCRLRQTLSTCDLRQKQVSRSQL